MKQFFFPLALLTLVCVFGGCKKEDPNDEKGLFGHGDEYKNLLENIKKNPTLANSITAEIKSKTAVFSATALKAGESAPKTIELDIKKKLEEQGISVEKLLSIKLINAEVTLDPARCDAVSVSIKRFELPESLQKFEAVKSVSCDASAVNRALALFRNFDFAPALKKGGKVLLEYSVIANKDLPATANAASVNITTQVTISTQ
jgi:hypothetical protein